LTAEQRERFANRVKAHPRVTVRTISAGNRDDLPAQMTCLHRSYRNWPGNDRTQVLRPMNCSNIGGMISLNSLSAEMGKTRLYPRTTLQCRKFFRRLWRPGSPLSDMTRATLEMLDSGLLGVLQSVIWFRERG
jgi:hypothetical protein